MEEFKRLIKLGVKKNASDIHLVSGAVPYFRIARILYPVKKPIVTEKNLDVIMRTLLSQDQAKILKDRGSVDLGLEIDGVLLRINVHRQTEGLGMSIRLLPMEIPSKDDIGLTDKILEITKMTEGFVIISGPAGCGKSTSLATLIEIMNQTSSYHIMTLEDPIEYRFKNKKSLIEQRQLGTDFKTFPEALQGVLRQDPDVLVVGEMRDPETISLALTAAETGHLVLSTLHAPNASEAVERIVNVFDGMEQQQVLVQLAATLQMVVAQRLLPAKKGGLVAAREILVTNSAVENAIRQNNLSTIRSAIQTGRRYGMISLEQSIKELKAKNIL